MNPELRNTFIEGLTQEGYATPQATILVDRHYMGVHDDSSTYIRDWLVEKGYMRLPEIFREWEDSLPYEDMEEVGEYLYTILTDTDGNHHYFDVFTYEKELTQHSPSNHHEERT